MQKKKKWLFFLIVFTLFLIVGCSSNNEEKTPDTSNVDNKGEDNSNSEQEEVVLRISFWAGSQMTIDQNQKVIDLFESAYPYIKVESEFAPGDAYMDRINTQAASNSLPDVIRVDYAQIKNFVNNDLLIPIDEYVDDLTIDMEGVDPIHLAGGKINDKLYGINIGNNSLVAFYDPDLLEKAGVEFPEGEYSWEEYESAIRSVREKLDIYGDGHLNKDHFEVWLRQHDVKLYNADGNGLGYDDDKLLEDFLSMQLRWQEENLITPIGKELEVGGLEDGSFPKAESAFGSGYWSNHADIMEEQLGKEVGFAMYPGPGKGMYIKPSFFHSIAKSSEHPKEAALLIDFYTNNIDAAKSLNAYFGMPYHPKVLEGMEDSFTETQKRISEYLKIVEEHSDVIDPPAPVAGAEVITVFENISNEVFHKQITPEEAAKKFRDEALTILSR